MRIANKNAYSEIVSQPMKAGTLKIAVADFECISPMPSLLGTPVLDLHHFPQHQAPCIVHCLAPSSVVRRRVKRKRGLLAIKTQATAPHTEKQNTSARRNPRAQSAIQSRGGCRRVCRSD